MDPVTHAALGIATAVILAMFATSGVTVAQGKKKEAAAAAGAAFAAPASSTRSLASTLPSLTASPTLTLSETSTPACELGTSIVALSDSSVTRP